MGFSSVPDDTNLMMQQSMANAGYPDDTANAKVAGIASNAIYSQPSFQKAERRALKIRNKLLPANEVGSEVLSRMLLTAEIRDVALQNGTYRVQASRYVPGWYRKFNAKFRQEMVELMIVGFGERHFLRARFAMCDDGTVGDLIEERWIRIRSGGRVAHS